jgi:anti-sigma B factor antagonist
VTNERKDIEIVVRNTPAVQALCLCGDLCDGGVLETRRAILEAIEGGAPRIAVDLSGVEYISSAGIGMLVSMLKRCHQNGLDFALAGLNEEVRELFSLTRLDEVFPIAPDLETWCRAFQ